MTLTMFEASVPVFRRGLATLSAVLWKGVEHTAAGSVTEASLVGARLAPDMLTLAGQVQRASDTAKFAACRLTGAQPPVFSDTEASFAELQARLDLTVRFLDQFDPVQFEASAERIVTLGSGGTQRVFDGKTYLLGFALPNFYFHVTTAYDILRHCGVRIGKNDYIGRVGR